MDKISLLADLCTDKPNLVDGAAQGNGLVIDTSDLAQASTTVPVAESYEGRMDSDSEQSSLNKRLYALDQDHDGDASGSGSVSRLNTPGKASRGNWTEDEDEKLRQAVAEFSGKNWKKIAERIPERSDVQCLHRWQKVLRPGLIKGPWTPEV